jgi:hypothetical protein
VQVSEGSPRQGRRLNAPATGAELLTVRHVVTGTRSSTGHTGLVLGEPLQGRRCQKVHDENAGPQAKFRCCVIRSGLRNAEIASLFHLSPNTVKVHSHRLYGKLGVTDRTQALLWADRHGVEPAQ